MQRAFPASVLLALSLVGAPVWAATNPEDQPILDEPVAPVPPGTATPASTSTAPKPVAQPDSGETITVPKSVWEQLLKDVADLKAGRAAATPTALPAGTPSAPTESVSTTGTKNYLLLPDISFVANSTALASSDKRNGDRNSLSMEGEIGIQGYVYPGVKYDTFLTANPGEGEALGIEEGYMTFQHVTKGLDVNLGRKFAAFGRTGELHPHSWLTTQQVLPRRSLVSGENLVGNGVQFNYLLPTPKSFFARASFGAFGNGDGSESRFNSFDTSDPFEGGSPTGAQAGYSRFYTGRLWMGKSFGESTEVELGASAARGRSSVTNILADASNPGSSLEANVDGRVNLTGLDFQLRHFTGINKRVLLRSEYFKQDPKGLPTSAASGYYTLLNYRPDKFSDYGLLFEKTGFTNAPGVTEKALSAIYTRRLSEQYAVRLTGTRGSRTGERDLNELRLQFIAGIGPHKHNIE